MLHSQERSKQTILVVDDDANIRRILATRLSMAGYIVSTAADGSQALTSFRQQAPDLIVLDVMMPELDGYDVCRTLRKESNVPIILLTALANVADRITGLEAGADDYMVKPFSPKELETRIRCILRRLDKVNDDATTSGILEVGSLRIETYTRKVYQNNVPVRLTDMEFNMLKLLVSQAGVCISRLEILEKVWGYNQPSLGDVRIVDVHISRLREKLQALPEQAESIVTVRGKGYIFPRVDS
ncbi:response regulator transcription factor RpaB [Stenomitos frigidus]|uniref:Probable transcriptional regulator ycf27 n=1 Tax=Stenomitos frigidus ULC18 TaxID=2107698 RepID=A0A2T1EA05_9CYAN|nr:response regulator [Stenomitos frigidus]PSB29560.1 DNA-binding response regulator [Stenomitos frigidus ULC18]